VEGSDSTWSQEARVNDMGGPFSNVWMFSPANGDAINVVIQTAADRFTHFSFGFLDPRGMHETDVAYVSGLYWFWWRDRENYQNNNSPFNNPGAGEHQIGVFGDRHEVHHAIPDGLLDPAFNFRDGGWVTQDSGNAPNVWQTCTRFFRRIDGTNETHGYMLDFFMAVDNQAQTGGVALHALPVIVYSIARDAKAYIGEFYDIRLCNMSGLAIAQTLSFADDEWMVFPLKQLGTPEATMNSVAPQPYCNSIYYGLAYRKVA
jgi:hypothetical protein